MLPGHPLIKLYPFFAQNTTGTIYDHISSLKMKLLTLLCCFFTVIIAEKQLKLEDIERDNLASERENKEQKNILKFSPKYSQPYNPPSFKSTQQNNFGFTPIKPSSINQDKPKLQFQSTRIQQEIQPEPIPEQIQYVPTQYYYQQQPQIQSQPQPQPQINNQYSQNPQYPYEQSPYIIDNQINTPQYVYLQPSSSNNIQMVVDSKGQVKYFMYVPVQYVKQDQYRGSPDSQYNSVGPQIFTQETEYQPQNSENQYVSQPQFESSQQPQQQLSFVPSEKSQYTSKGEPQSLLDSYVPSVLQYQYYKQQEQQNGLNSLVKKSSGKTSQKNYNSPQQIYTIPTGSSELSYSPQLPTTFKSYSSVKSNQK